MVGHPVGQAAIVKRGEDTRATRTVRERKCVARQFRPRMRPRSVLLFFFWHLTQCNPFTSGAPHPRDMSHDTPRDATTVVVCSRPVRSGVNTQHTPEPHTRKKRTKSRIRGIHISYIRPRPHRMPHRHRAHVRQTRSDIPATPPPPHARPSPSPHTAHPHTRASNRIHGLRSIAHIRLTCGPRPRFRPIRILPTHRHPSRKRTHAPPPPSRARFPGKRTCLPLALVT